MRNQQTYCFRKLLKAVAVPVVFPLDGCSLKAVIVFVVVSGFVRAPSVMTGWGFAVV